MKADVVSFQAWWARWYKFSCRSNIQVSHTFICSITMDSGGLIDEKTKGTMEIGLKTPTAKQLSKLVNDFKWNI